MADFQKAVQLINATSLSEEDKNFWLTELKNLPENRLAVFVYFLQNLPEKLPWLTSLQKRKKQAFAKGDTTTWDALLQEEEAELEKIESEGGQNARN